MNSLSKKTQDFLIDLFTHYYGLNQQQLIKELDLQFNGVNPKNIGHIITKKILANAEKDGFKSPNDLFIKTIRINKQGTPLESMSFAQIKYKEIINEEWEDSYLFKTLNKEFLFIIFKSNEEDRKNPILSKVVFWKMNNVDLDLASKFWELTKENIKRGDYNNFITIKNNFICHVRSKGLNSYDLMDTPQGTQEPKKGYWLNASYIKSQI